MKKEKAGLLVSIALFTIGYLSLMGPAFSWDDWMPNDFTLEQRELTSPLRVAWDAPMGYGYSIWTYSTDLDPKAAETRIHPFIAGWAPISTPQGYGYEREVDGPFILFNRHDGGTEITAGSERVEPTLLARGLVHLPLDKMGLERPRHRVIN